MLIVISAIVLCVEFSPPLIQQQWYVGHAGYSCENSRDVASSSGNHYLVSPYRTYKAFGKYDIAQFGIRVHHFQDGGKAVGLLDKRGNTYIVFFSKRSLCEEALGLTGKGN